MSTLKNMLEVSSGSLEKAEQIARKIIKNGNKEVLLDLQLLLAAQGKWSEINSVQKDIDTFFQLDNPRVNFNRAHSVLRSGDLYNGIRLLDYGRNFNNFGNKFPIKNIPVWNREDSLYNKTIIFYCEGGFGDEIINFRFIFPLFEEYRPNLIVACHPKLKKLFHQSYPWLTVISRTILNQVEFDTWIPAMSAPYYLNLNYDKLLNKKYIEIPKNESWKLLLKSNKIKIGIRWSGNPKFEHEQFRKFPIELMTALSEIPNTQFYSFQRDNDMIDLPKNIIDLSLYIKEWEDTAAALNEMDLVISSCTAVAHLAAAMGKETLIVVPILPYYVWAEEGNKSTWYPTVTLYRQTKFGDWKDPFDKLRRDLNDRCDSKNV